MCLFGRFSPYHELERLNRVHLNRWDRSLGLRDGLQRKMQSFTRLQTTCVWQVIGSVAGRRRSPPLCLAAVFVLVVEDTLASSSIPSARAGKRADAG